jgi:CARDB
MKPNARTITGAFAVTVAALFAPGAFATVTHSWTPPVVQAVKLLPSASVAGGGAVTVECDYIGGATMTIVHNGQGADAYWHQTTGQVPIEIRVGGASILSKMIPGASPGAPYSQKATWNAPATVIGQQLPVECVIDPAHKIHFSSKTASLTVLGKPVPRARIGNQPPLVRRATPGGPTPPAAGLAKRKLPPPDLVVTTVKYLVSPCSVEGKYSKLTIYATIKNEGKGPVAGVGGWGIPVIAYANTALIIPPNTLKPIAYGPTTLKAGASFEATLDLVIGPATNNKDYDIVVQVDPNSIIAESNENNNFKVGVNIPAQKNYCTAK